LSKKQGGLQYKRYVMQAILYEPLPKSKRIKVFIPFEFTEIRSQIKSMNGSYWHQQQKLWSVINTPKNRYYLEILLKGHFIIEKTVQSKIVEKTPLNIAQHDEVLALQKTLTLKRYSDSTIRTYKNLLGVFLTAFSHKKITDISNADIEEYIHSLIASHHISASYQNQLINAIKAYYEHVLGRERTFYKITRPKKPTVLPNVLSREEVAAIITYPTNLKHRAILTTIYSAGLRISELINLRVVDIRTSEGYIFVKDSKGKKDRHTILAESLLPLLRAYYKEYRPSYWLFEGQTGGAYSVGSVRAIFRKAVAKTGSNPWATVHTLRHSFATHCIEDNVNMRHVQIMLGHNSSKTTEIYTKTVAINNKKVTSPLDKFLK
jgi:site-specific recombinase XerD